MAERGGDATYRFTLCDANLIAPGARNQLIIFHTCNGGRLRTRVGRSRIALRRLACVRRGCPFSISEREWVGRTFVDLKGGRVKETAVEEGLETGLVERMSGLVDGFGHGRVVEPSGGGTQR